MNRSNRSCNGSAKPSIAPVGGGRIITRPDDIAQLETLQQLGKRFGIPLVAAGNVHMHVRRRKPLQDVQTAIRLGTPVAQLGRALYRP